MNKFNVIYSILLAGCVAVPTKDESHTHKCYLSSDKKTLKVVDLNGEGSGNYYSVSGVVLSPITMLVSGVVSGVYVVVHNTYHLGEETFVCS
ncbi:hypothetical protein [Thalassomonas sp. M1454]|uniref:hypothetical protein n=1 Tax=Thalassomonas sp. M1454 TaxID=2594477 RepID=UPI0011814F3F|nr:hypothetical protein [Thalassomonas sp. M1454]TRX57004.1 hypothetical protein FNN08_05705 [Thalassomonas sp. M1454]